MRKIIGNIVLLSLALVPAVGCQKAEEVNIEAHATTNSANRKKMFPAGTPPAADTAPNVNADVEPNADDSAAQTEKTTQTAAANEKNAAETVIDLRQPQDFDEPNISATEKSAIVRAVYGKDDKKVAVSSMIKGAFTASGASETAYILQPGGRRAIDPSSLDSTILAIFDGAKLVGKYPAKSYNAFLPATDINHDGKNEILMTGNNYQMGIATMWAQLVAISGAKLEVVKDFKLISYDSCDSETSPELKVAEIKAFAPTRFETQFYRAECPTNPDGNRYPNMFKPIPDKEIEN